MYNISDIYTASLTLLELFVRTKAFEARVTPKVQLNTYKERIAHTFNVIDSKGNVPVTTY